MMTDKEKVEFFGIMVDASEKVSKPWREIAFKVLSAMIITNILWAIALCLIVWFAYMSPDTTYQAQEFEGHQQMQSSGTEVITKDIP